MHPPRRLVPLVLGTALLVLATACGGAAAAPAAAHVAGTDVTDAELAVTAGVFESLFGLQHAPCGQTDGADDTAAAACNRYSLAANSCRLIIRDLVNLPENAERVRDGNFSFLRTNAIFERAMEIGRKRNRWLHRHLK